MVCCIVCQENLGNDLEWIHVGLLSEKVAAGITEPGDYNITTYPPQWVGDISFKNTSAKFKKLIAKDR